MAESTKVEAGGCVYRLVVLVLLLWFAAVPVASPYVVHRVRGERPAPDTGEWAPIAVVAVASVVPFVLLAILARTSGVGAMGSALAVASGYLVLEAAITALAADRSPMPLTARYTAATLRVAILLPYAAAAAWWAPHLAGRSRRPLVDWLGWRRPPASTWFLALALAALLTLPWPLTGALGDSLTSLAVATEVLSVVVPRMLIFWGVVFILLTETLPRTASAAGMTTVIYALSTLAPVLSGSVISGMVETLLLLQLGVLLAEMRARGGSALHLIPLAFLYRLAPALFTDPRDVIASGIPELQHLAAYGAIFLTTILLALVLWLRRRASDGGRRTDPSDADRGRGPVGALALAAAVLWGVWAAVYVFAGEPGFFNDGFLIILQEQADLESAYGIPDREERLRTVYRRLVETAEATQGPIRSELDELGVAYRPYYVINMIRVDGHRWLMDRFEGRSGVARVILNPNVRPYPRRIPLPYGSAPSEEGIQGNLAAIHADAAWERGVRGEGIVVGGQDTGYDWDHPALKRQYRGWDGETADHAYNWHDAWSDARTPFDDGSHGTHTMGTVVGDGGPGSRIGVAPRATWFGCRNMRRGVGNPGSYAECMEFLMAPYPPGGDPFRDGDVGRAAHVTNNSWGCPRWEGCAADTLRPAVEAHRAAGIAMVVSAGNDGPACGSATSPPANYDGSLTVGATTDGGRVVGFSSRGPVAGLIKPDIAAPGQQVRSSVPGGGYAATSGTSMASPHVAGTVALVWSARESWIGDVAGTEALLCRTAVDKPVSDRCRAGMETGLLAAAGTPPPCACGGTSGVPNNVYGCGMLDAGAAVEEVLDE
jgi:subtilisin family serine protease